MNNDELGTLLARAVFRTGDYEKERVQRIEFKGGTWPDHEIDLGGLCEKSLADVITRELNHLISNNEGK